MLNENKMRPLLFAGVAAVHLLLIFFFAFSAKITQQPPVEFANVMKLVDITEYVPSPPPQLRIPDDRATVESIAETMIETDFIPDQNVLASGVFLNTENFVPMHQLSRTPRFDEDAIAADLVYPQIALRSGIEGRVILDLFVDLTGLVRRVEILREEPEGRGFGEAAARAFMGRKGEPAIANGQVVSARYRYPVVFRIK